MLLKDIRRDHENGLVEGCSVDEVMGRYCLKFRYRSGQWEVLELQREGSRLFKSVDAALKIAKDVGFKEVRVLM